MKLFKSLFIVMCISLILSAAAVAATLISPGSFTMLDVRIPRNQNEHYIARHGDGVTGTFVEIHKTNTAIQAFHHQHSQLTGSGTLPPIQARVEEHVHGQGFPANWSDGTTIGRTVIIPDGNSVGRYHLHIRTERTVTSDIRFWGSWHF